MKRNLFRKRHEPVILHLARRFFTWLAPWLLGGVIGFVLMAIFAFGL